MLASEGEVYDYRSLLGGQLHWACSHLEFLLGYKVLHAPDDLDGGPVVIPQPEEEGAECEQLPCS